MTEMIFDQMLTEIKAIFALKFVSLFRNHFFQSPKDKTEATPSTKCSAAAANPMQ